MKNTPVAWSSDQMSTSEPGGRPLVLGNVIGAGFANVRPIGWIVSTWPGSSVSGSAPGVNPGGTSDRVIWPVYRAPLSSITLFGGTSMRIPSAVFSRIVVCPGSTCTALLVSMRGMYTGCGIENVTPGCMALVARYDAYTMLPLAVLPSNSSVTSPGTSPLIVKLPLAAVVTLGEPLGITRTVAPGTGVVMFCAASTASRSTPVTAVGAPGCGAVTVRVTLSLSMARPSRTVNVSV